MLRNIWFGFSRYAQRRPRVVAFSTAGLMGTAGDITAQQIGGHDGESPEEHVRVGPLTINPRRAIAMGSFCAGLATIVYVPFYYWMDRFFGPGMHVTNALKKTALNQLALTPFFDLPVYFSFSAWLEGHDFDSAYKRFKTTYFDSLIGTWCVWLPVSAVNFTLVPIHFRVPVAYVGEFGWACVVSWTSHRKKD